MTEWTKNWFLKEQQRNEGKQQLNVQTNEWRNKQMHEKRIKKLTTKGDWQTNLPSPSVSTNSFIAFAKIQKELL